MYGILINRIRVLLVGEEMEIYKSYGELQNNTCTWLAVKMELKWRAFHKFILNYAGYIHIGPNLSLKII